MAAKTPEGATIDAEAAPAVTAAVADSTATDVQPDDETPSEPVADGITTTLNENGDIVPLETPRPREYNHATGAFE
ncbi:MAG: hypothetical protein ABIP33_06400 [Pseudolysinimonas sp.]